MGEVAGVVAASDRHVLPFSCFFPLMDAPIMPVGGERFHRGWPCWLIVMLDTTYLAAVMNR